MLTQASHLCNTAGPVIYRGSDVAAACGDCGRISAHSALEEFLPGENIHRIRVFAGTVISLYRNVEKIVPPLIVCYAGYRLVKALAPGWVNQLLLRKSVGWLDRSRSVLFDRPTDFVARIEDLRQGNLGFFGGLHLLWQRMWISRAMQHQLTSNEISASIQVDLFEYQLRLESICRNAMPYAPFALDFYYGSSPTLGDFRKLSRGELNIQLMRLLTGFASSREQARHPLDPAQVAVFREDLTAFAARHHTTLFSR